MFVHSGLINAVRGKPEAVTFVVGHEVGHALGEASLSVSFLFPIFSARRGEGSTTKRSTTARGAPRCRQHQYLLVGLCVSISQHLCRSAPHAARHAAERMMRALMESLGISVVVGGVTLLANGVRHALVRRLLHTCSSPGFCV